MGLYPQPNKWQCGPFALKHALVMLGKFVDEDHISRIAGTHWWAGTDEIKLGRAAKRYDAEMRIIRRKNKLAAKRELIAALRKGRPALLCVDEWSHWITVVGYERGKFISIDSREAPVVVVNTWSQLEKRWVFYEEDEDDPTIEKTLYDLHIVVPRFRVRTKAHFSLKRARYLRRHENHTFAIHWEEYFNDLTSICQPRTPLSENILPFGEFVRRHGPMIKAQVAYWHGDVSRDQVGKILRNMQFVADTYDLVIRNEDEKKSIAAITTLLTLWAASKTGVDEVYGNGA